MESHPERVMDQEDFPIWLAPNEARRVRLLVGKAL
jgi:hypothetical protein